MITKAQKVAKYAADHSQGSKLVTAADLQYKTFPDPNWIVPGLIPEGLSILAGQGKIGKSWFCLDLAIGVASGGTVLGNIEVEQGTVLYLALEDNQRRLKNRMKLLNHHSENWPSKLIFQTLEQTNHWHMDNGGLDRLRKFVADYQDTRLIIVDTVKKIRPPKRSNAQLDYERDYGHMVPLQELAQNSGICILLVHHTTKMKHDDVFNEISGSTGLSAAADTLMVLTRARTENNGVLHVTGRDVAEAEKALQKDVHTQRWILIGDSYEVELHPARKEILAVLPSPPAGKYPREVAKELRKNPSTTNNLLIKMAEAGTIMRASHDGAYSQKPPPPES